MKEEKKKTNFYTDECPGGPWSRALKAMVERDKRLRELEWKKSEEKKDKELKTKSPST